MENYDNKVVVLRPSGRPTASELVAMLEHVASELEKNGYSLAGHMVGAATMAVREEPGQMGGRRANAAPSGMD